MKKKHSLWRVVAVSFGISLLLSAAILLMTEDVFRLVSKKEEISVVIPEEATVREVSHILGEKGLVKLPFLYELYADLRGWSGEYLAGEFTLSADMGYDELRYMLSPKKGVRTQMRLTIPEGFTTDEIISLCVEKGIGTREGFLAVIDGNETFGYDFVGEIPANEGRIHRLDGYLFPDTYFVYTDSTETEIIAKLLKNFDRRFDESLRAKAKERGMTVDELVTLASIVQGEAYYPSDMGGIASVFYNRLRSAAFPCLQSDATVKYAKEAAGNGETLDAADLDTLESPYNTYKEKGLPPGPICSPGMDALTAALSPADTKYYYFLSKKDKTTVFSRTYKEHLQAIASLKQ